MISTGGRHERSLLKTDMRIVSDIDCCLADFNGLMNDIFGPGDQSLYHLEERWPDKEKEILELVENPFTYSQLKPISRSVQAINSMAAVHELIAVTARPVSPEMEFVTREWLKWWGYKFSAVYVKDSEEKATFIKSLLPDYAIDDSPHQIQRMRELGIMVMIFDQEWNRNLSGIRKLSW